MIGSRCLLVLLLSTSSVSCRAPDDKVERSATGERYASRGRIVGVSPKSLDIHHARLPAIRGFDGTIKPMESMTMPFARDQVSAEVAVGDLVQFEFTVHYDVDPTLRLIEIGKLPADTKLELR